jgi:tRNA/rRNA methyltransferase
MKNPLILIRPATPATYAAARAMKVMGLSDLVLVAPRYYRVAVESIQRASGALDVLNNADCGRP